MNQNPFGVLWHLWNALDPTLTVTRMGCILSSLHSQRSILFFLENTSIVYIFNFFLSISIQHQCWDLNLEPFHFFTVPQLVELLDSPLHNYFKQNDCLNYFFCFRWILIQFKRFVSSFLPLSCYCLDVSTTASFWAGKKITAALPKNGVSGVFVLGNGLLIIGISWAMDIICFQLSSLPILQYPAQNTQNTWPKMTQLAKYPSRVPPMSVQNS